MPLALHNTASIVDSKFRLSKIIRDDPLSRATSSNATT